MSWALLTAFVQGPKTIGQLLTDSSPLIKNSLSVAEWIVLSNCYVIKPKSRFRSTFDLVACLMAILDDATPQMDPNLDPYAAHTPYYSQV